MSKETMISVAADTPKLDAIRKVLSKGERREINSAAAASLHALCKRHVLNLSESRHKTADDLGAKHTGHLAMAARTMTFGADADGGYVAVHSSGFKRVFGSFYIIPVVAKALTIPVHHLAYGKRVSDLQRDGIKVFRPRGRDYLAMNAGGGIVPLYILARSVFMPQDRSLLPSDGEMSAAARRGVLDVIERALEGARAGGTP